MLHVDLSFTLEKDIIFIIPETKQMSFALERTLSLSQSYTLYNPKKDASAQDIEN